MNQSYHLYVISFTVGAEAGLAIVAAGSDRDAFQILKNGGSRNHEGYRLIQTRDIGMTANCTYGLLLESYVNALEAFEAITSTANYMIGPQGEPGEKGDKGDEGKPPFDNVRISVDNNTGTPYANSTIVPNAQGGKTLDIGFHSIKGAPGTSISNITQTVVSASDEGNNEITVTLSDGRSSKFYVRNGSTGVKDVQAYVDPYPGTPRVVTDFQDGIMTMTLYGLKGANGEPGMNNTITEVLEDIADMPVASSETANIIYFVYNDNTGNYDRYFTSFDGSSYSYIQAGSATVNFSDYQRKDDDIWLTREEFDAIEIKDNTKTYNIYEEEYSSTEPTEGSE